LLYVRDFPLTTPHQPSCCAITGFEIPPSSGEGESELIAFNAKGEKVSFISNEELAQFAALEAEAPASLDLKRDEAESSLQVPAPVKRQVLKELEYCCTAGCGWCMLTRCGDDDNGCVTVNPLFVSYLSILPSSLLWKLPLTRHTTLVNSLRAVPSALTLLSLPTTSLRAKSTITRSPSWSPSTAGASASPLCHPQTS